MKKMFVLFCLMFATAVQADPPVFHIAISEYPSWSTYMVASMVGLIDGDEGKMGPIEEKYNVDIVVEVMDYDSCIGLYQSGKSDAVCITNIDVVSPSLKLRSVAILPTSTSKGADALLVNGSISSIKQLQNKEVYGLDGSCSRYMFDMNLVRIGENPAMYKFLNRAPDAAALAMQQKEPGTEAIVVWNPFVMQTKNRRHDVKVLFDSSTLPEEIIDMVVMSQQSLDKEGGDRFAQAVIDTYYQVCDRIFVNKDQNVRDETLVKLGEKFCHLTVGQMRTCVRETSFYKNSTEGLTIFRVDPKQPEKSVLGQTMKKVVEFCTTELVNDKGEVVRKKMADRAPVIGYGTKAECPNTNLRFDTTYIKKVAERKQKQP